MKVMHGMLWSGTVRASGVAAESNAHDMRSGGRNEPSLKRWETSQRCRGSGDADKALAARLHLGAAVLRCCQQSMHIDLERSIHLPGDAISSGLFSV